MSWLNHLEPMPDMLPYLYVLDFDGTIFDSWRFKDKYFVELAKESGLEVKKVIEYYEDFKKLEKRKAWDWLNFLAEKLSISREGLIETARRLLEQEGHDRIYADFLKWFIRQKENLRETKIIILTAWPEDFQRAKVEAVLGSWLWEGWKDYFEVAPVSNLNRKTDYLKEIINSLGDKDRKIVFVDNEAPDGIDALLELVFVKIEREGDLGEGELGDYPVVKSFEWLSKLLHKLGEGVSGELASTLWEK